MKKVLLIALLLLSLVTAGYCANATVTNTEWGSEITGGVSATVIYNGTMWVKAIGVVPSVVNDTAVFTSGASNVSCLKVIAPVVNDTKSVYFGDKGIPFTNLTVTLNTTSDIVYVYNQ